MEEKDGWLYVTVTKWVWDKANLHRILSTLKEQGVVHFRDRGYFNIDWDFVIEHSRNKEVCFFCRLLMLPNKKTKTTSSRAWFSRLTVSATCLTTRFLAAMIAIKRKPTSCLTFSGA